MGRRDIEFGHNDMGMPDDLEGILRHHRRILLYSSINAKKWGIPPFALEGLKIQYRMAKATLDECGPDLPPEPDPLDGFTIYWDRRRRMEELFCGFVGLPVGEDGNYDRAELARRTAANKDFIRSQEWKEYLIGCIRETAARYHMPSEWLENHSRRILEITPPPRNSGGNDIQRFLLLFYKEESP